MVEGLEGVVQLANEGVADLSLDLFFGDHELNEPVVSLFLHSLQREVVICSQVLDQIDLCVASLS